MNLEPVRETLFAWLDISEETHHAQAAICHVYHASLHPFPEMPVKRLSKA